MKILGISGSHRKGATEYCGVVKKLCGPLKRYRETGDARIPQLFTALAGGAVALLILRGLRAAGLWAKEK
ncbi:MAG TPA: hypothetical protein GX507_07035 [Clostridia bacterium]|nr:hypothetical protein [Clostridia bacterium]